MAGDDSDSSEEAARVVLSAKDKRFEDLSKACEELRVRFPVHVQSQFPACMLAAARQIVVLSQQIETVLLRTITNTQESAWQKCCEHLACGFGYFKERIG
jgi:hypothetical protein